MTISVAPGERYFEYPYSLEGLPDDVHLGLIPIGLFGLFSVLTTFGLLVFITYRMVFWQKYYTTYVGYNQNVVLIYNLLLADLIQAASFVMSFHWYRVDSILAPTNACSIQGVLVHFGDVASGAFVLLIALQTMYAVLYGRTVSHWSFVSLVVSCWVFAVIMTGIGPALHPHDFFTRAGAWCWANPRYEAERLYTHYLWIFIDQFGTFVIYAIIFIFLRKKLRKLGNTPGQAAVPASREDHRVGYAHPSGAIIPRTTSNITSAGNNNAHAKVSRATGYMVFYPFAYLLCTLPLATGRMYSMATGQDHSATFYIVAGCLFTSAGWIDALLYTLTRRVLVSNPSGQYRGAPANPARRVVSEITLPGSGRGGRASRLHHHLDDIDTDDDDSAADVKRPRVAAYAASDDPELDGARWPMASFAGARADPRAPSPFARTVVITGGRDNAHHHRELSQRTPTPPPRRRPLMTTPSMEALRVPPPDDFGDGRAGSADEVLGGVKAETKVEITVETASSPRSEASSEATMVERGAVDAEKAAAIVAGRGPWGG